MFARYGHDQNHSLLDSYFRRLVDSNVHSPSPPSPIALQSRSKSKSKSRSKTRSKTKSASDTGAAVVNADGKEVRRVRVRITKHRDGSVSKSGTSRVGRLGIT